MNFSTSKRVTLAAVAVAVTGALSSCAPNLVTFGNGVTPVGTGPGQVKPGLYTTTVSLCSWFRQTDLSPDTHKPLLGGHTGWGGGRQFVQLLPKDVGIDSQGCGKWVVPLATSYNGAGTQAKTGEYRVRRDLLPGTYYTAGVTNRVCQWWRLRSFDGSTKSVIATAGNYGPMTVTIAPTDVGFDNQNCGTWTRIG
jgi:hypothetical protein